MPETVRFYGHWKKLVFAAALLSLANLTHSSKLGEENARIRRLGPSISKRTQTFQPVIVGGRQRVGPSDDEGSVIEGDHNSFCGACRTRESNVWWKAPKGLFTNVLCDSCGATWRKYADLNVRPLREESISSNKSKSLDKREGTPLMSHMAKRTKVPFLFNIVLMPANEMRVC
jgi:hypothetical protein